MANPKKKALNEFAFLNKRNERDFRRSNLVMYYTKNTKVGIEDTYLMELGKEVKKYIFLNERQIEL